MKTSVQIVRNILGNWGSIFLGMIVGFLMMPFLIHTYGADRYGVWVLTLNFTGYLGLLNLGVGGSIVKYVAEFKAKNDTAALNEICSTSFFLYLCAGIVAAVFALIISEYFIGHFKIPAVLLPEAKWVVLIVGLQIASSIPLGTFSSYMRGIQRYDAIAFIAVVALIIRTAVIVWFVLDGYGLICLALIHLGSAWLEGIMRIVYVYKKDDHFQLNLNLITAKSIKIVFDYSLFFFLYFVSIRLIFAIDSLLIGYFLGTAAITFYTVAYRLTEYILLLIMGTGVLQPTVSQNQALSQEDKNQVLMTMGTKYVMMISLPVGVAYMIVGDQFLTLWMGAKYAVMSYPILVILTIGMIAHLVQYVAIQILQGMAKHSPAAYMSMLQVAATVGLIIWMMNRYGITGAAFGKTIPMILFNFIAIPWYTSRLLKISFGKFLGTAFIPPALSVLVFAAVLYALAHLIPIHSWAIFCVEILSASSIYLVCATLLCFTKKERTDRYQQIRAALTIAR